ncbi:non-ribosomal peptide synthetase [Micromonospora radicis]|uniref:Amino acid adenylation domain-containing protein n=1 Tax=Micromonospora radicis TaxID=1894971 RepID=A0A418N171_9ACTN|nr:non-ribosomal peptide synthetase [Micromonospora radicis]RIV41495.1 amino acid adenylation domain-containing protein [Micromonospora radicis]
MTQHAQRLSTLTAEQRALLLKQVGAQLTERQRPSTRIPRRPQAGDRAPVSYLQEQLWFLDQLVPGQSTYNVPSVFRLRGPLDLTALRRALADIVERHEALRTTIRAENGEPYQHVAEPGEQPHQLVVDDLSDIADPPARLAEGQRRVQEEIRRPFDLATGPLFRSLLVRLDDTDHLLAVTMHHVASDGWSQAVLTNELSELYAAHHAGRPPALQPLPVQYGDYAAWQRNQLSDEVFDGQLDYWQQRLRGLPTLELPTDRPRPATMSYRSAAVSHTLGGDLLHRLRQLSARNNTTLFMTLMTAYQAVLARYSGQDEIVVGTTTTGREPAELEPLIGYFVNMVVLRTDVADDPTFGQLLQRVRGVVLEAWKHQQVPFEKVVERIQPVRDPSRNPLFQVGLQLLGSATQSTEPNLPGLTVSALDANPGGHPFDLSITATESPDQLRLVADYSVDLFDEPRMARLLRHLERVLRAAVDAPDTPLSALPLLDEEERTLLLHTWQGPKGQRAREPVHVQIARLATERPDLVAATLDGAELTYGELHRRATVLAHRFRDLGVGREDIVALLLERGFDLIVGMVAAQQAGGAFVVMDPGHPVRRIEFILADTAAKAVVTRDALADRLPEESGATRVLVDTDWPALEQAAGAAAPLTELADENSLAYVLYTSGSTGKPKGVMIEHHALNTFLLWLGNIFDFGPGDRLLQHMAPIFDFAEGEIFTALTRGVTMVFVPEEHRTDPDVIGQLLVSERITYIGGPPAILGRIPPGAYPDLKYMIAGGEAVTGDLINRWNTPGRRFINGYGPTEAAVGCIYYECEHRTWTGQPPIGRAMPNRVAYVLDRFNNLQPIGVPGEVVTGGEGLARGYLNRPELTAEKFLDDPYRPGERMYRTGDLGVWSEDGQIQFLGRIDTQVKLNGLRIELEEIESTLTAHPGVAEAAVALREDSPGTKRLVGYVVPAASPAPDTEQLREHLLADLPPYMVPHVFVALEVLPLTSVGKVDRNRLPAPEEAGPAAQEAFVAPRTVQEEQVAEIFAAVLGVDRVGADANFFELGGNSLMAARVLSRIAEVGGVSATMRDFYTRPRVSEIAQLLTGAGPAEPVAEPAADPARARLEQEIADLEQRLRAARAALAGQQGADDSRPAGHEGQRLPLSPTQEQLWFLEQLAPGQPTYHIPVPVRLTGPLDAELLGQALTAVVARHEALRTTFGADDDTPYQLVSPAGDVALPVSDLSTVADRDQALRVELERDATTPFDLGRDQMLRARLLRLDGAEHVLSLVLHHICADGWSAGVLVRDLAEYYDALRHARQPQLPTLRLQYADHALTQRRRLDAGELAPQLAYWQRQLADAPTADLPTDRPRPATASNRGALLVHRMPVDVLHGLRQVAQQEQASTYAVLLAGFKTVLMRYTGVDDIVVGTAGAGRDRPELEDLVGFFVNMLALRTDLSGDPSFATAVRRTMGTLLAAWEHQDAPFERVVGGLGRRRDPSRNPVFQVSIDLLSGDLVDFRFPGLAAEFLDVDPGVSRFDMAINAYEETDGITFRIEYATDLFDVERVRAMFGHLERLLRAAVAAPQTPLSALPLLDDAERAELLTLARGERREHRPTTLPELFAASVARAPQAPAVISSEGTLSYAELDERSRRLAARLRAEGVRTGDIVPVLLDRGVAEVVSVLAVLRAGAAYAPMDPAAPAARLAFQVRDTGARVVVGDPALAATLDGVSAVDPHAELPAAADEPWRSELSPSAVAYVLFTSGSTGEPKGVLIEHAMVVGYLEWMVPDFGVGPDARVLHCCAPVFDLAVGEMFSALAAGAAVVVAGPDEVHQPGALTELARATGATHVFTTPTVLGLLDPTRLPDLRAVMMAGEPAPPSLVATWNVDGRRVFNLYGPAEATVGCTWYECPTGAEPVPPVPIGRPMPNRRVYVVDDTGELAPVGVPGELVIAGPGVARGYLDRPELTAAAFGADDRAGDGRAYRSGDLGRWNRAGQLEFLGRRDGQVKLRGLRIELGEIEHALRAAPGVRLAAAAVHGSGADAVLVGYVVGELTDADLDTLRPALADRLPGYMVPNVVLRLPELPLTRTGKVDRKRLPAPDGGATRTAYVAPGTDDERAVAGVFADLLGLDRVGVEDEFFLRGGNSLQAIRAVGRLTDVLGVPLTVRDFYTAPSVAALAELAGRRRAAEQAAQWQLLDEIEQLSDDEVERLLAAD